MPRVENQVIRDRNLLASYFDELGMSGKLTEPAKALLRNAFLFGMLCKEAEIVEGRKLFESDEE